MVFWCIFFSEATGLCCNLLCFCLYEEPQSEGVGHEMKPLAPMGPWMGVFLKFLSIDKTELKITQLKAYPLIIKGLSIFV